MGKEITSVKKLLAHIRQEKSKTKNKLKEVRSTCTHKSKKGKFILKKDKKHPGVWKCPECGQKIDLSVFDVEDQKELKKYVKGVKKAYVNMLNVTKILMKPKTDGKLLKWLGNCQYSAERAQDLMISAVVDKFEPHKKNKHKKNKNGRAKVTSGFGSLDL